MNIAQISYYYLPVRGGQEVYIQNLQGILKAQGFRSLVYQPNRGVKSDDVVVVPRLPLIGRIIPFSAHHLFNWTLKWMYGRRAQEADVIIVHYAFFAKSVWNLRKKVIVLSHGIEWNLDRKSHYDRYCEAIGRASFDRFIIVANDTHYFRHFGLQIEPGKGFFKEVAPGKWFIPNCVDTSFFKKSEGPANLIPKQAVLVHRQITRDRGIDLAIRAFSLFNHLQAGYTLVILGQVPKNEKRYLSSCKDLVHTLGLDQQVIFLGPVQNHQMPEYYSSAALTLIPTLRREGTSLSALESMACGTPTVSTNVAGLADLPTVQAEPTPESIAQQMCLTIENRERIALEQAGTVSRVFNLENWRNAWLQVINQAGSRL